AAQRVIQVACDFLFIPAQPVEGAAGRADSAVEGAKGYLIDQRAAPKRSLAEPFQFCQPLAGASLQRGLPATAAENHALQAATVMQQVVQGEEAAHAVRKEKKRQSRMFPAQVVADLAQIAEQGVPTVPVGEVAALGFLAAGQAVAALVVRVGLDASGAEPF